MNAVTISEARRFSLAGVQRNLLVDAPDLRLELLCFEAGQRDEEESFEHTSVYQVLEGEALVHVGAERQRLGKGKLLTVPAATRHAVENAGGGLLVVMATRAR